MIVSQVVITQFGQQSPSGSGSYIPVTEQPVVLKADGLADGEVFNIEYSLIGGDGWIPFKPRGAQIAVSNNRNPIILATPGRYRVVAAEPGPTNATFQSIQGTISHEMLWLYTEPVILSGSAPGSGGTVTSVNISAPPEFVVSGGPVTSSGSISLNKSPQPANSFWAGPVSGASAEPTFRTLSVSDLPPGSVGMGTVTSVDITASSLLQISGGPITTSGAIDILFLDQNPNTFLAGPTSFAGSPTPTFRGIQLADLPPGVGVGTVTSVGIDAPAEFIVGSSPVTGAGVITLTKANEPANMVWAGPLSGPPATPSFRALSLSDLPSGVGSGTVTSVALSAPVEFVVTGSPVTTSGTLSLSAANQGPGLVWAGPVSGPAAPPSFRAIASTDLPVLPPSGGSVSSISYPAASNDYIDSSTQSGAVSGSNLLASFTYFTPYVGKRNYATGAGYFIKQLAIQLASGVAGSIFRLAIYDSNGNMSFYPGTLLFQSSDLSGAAAGTIPSSTFGPIQLIEGHVYWLGVTVNNTGLSVTSFNQNGAGLLSLGFSPASLNTFWLCLRSASGAGATPTPFPATSTLTAADRSNVQAPRILLQVN